MKKLLLLIAVLNIITKILVGQPIAIDVSASNTITSWAQIYSPGGKKVALVKATKGIYNGLSCANGGTGYTDGQFNNNMANGSAAGVVLGVYHFALPEDNTALAEANYFLSIAGSYIGPGYLPPALDIEDPAGQCVVNTQALAYYYTHSSTYGALAQWINDWCVQVHSVSGVWPMLYVDRCHAASLYPFYQSGIINSNINLWIADYSNDPGNPGNFTGCNWVGWPWKIHQYSEHGTVAGISGINNVDLDFYHCLISDFNSTTTLPTCFRPYVKGLTVEANTQSGSNLIYSAHWNWGAGPGPLALDPGQQSSRISGSYTSDFNSTDQVEIAVTFSAPMKRVVPTDMVVNLYSECQHHHLIASTDLTNLQNLPLSPDPIEFDHESSDHMTFYFIIHDVSLRLAHSEGQDIQIIAKDMADNNLMSLNESSAGGVDASSIAVRDVSGNWVNDDFNLPTGDQVHHFKIQGCFENFNNEQRFAGNGSYDGPITTDCLIPNFSASNTNPQAGISVSFTDQSTGSVSAWNWDFGDGSSSIIQNPFHSYQTPGTYDVSLAITGSQGASTETKVGYVVVTGDNSTLIAEFTTDFNIDAGESVNLTNQTSGGCFGCSVTYIWDTPGGIPSITTSTCPGNILFSTEGSYDIMLTAFDGTSSSPVTHTIIVNSGGGGNALNCSIGPWFMNATINAFNYHFETTYSGGIEPVTFLGWNFNDGSGSLSSVVDHQFPVLNSSPANYNVVAQWQDGLGNITACSTTVNVAPPVPNFSATINITAPDFIICNNQAPYSSLDANVVINPPYLQNASLCKWTVTLPSGNTAISNNNFATSNDHVNISALENGAYTFYVEVKFNNIIVSATKSINIICNTPVAAPLTVNTFTNIKPCFGSYISVAIAGGEMFAHDYYSPLNEQNCYQEFGMSQTEFYKLYPAQYSNPDETAPGYYYKISKVGNDPGTFPVDVSYDLHIYENRDDNQDGFHDETVVNKTLHYDCRCLNPNEVNAGADKFTCINHPVIIGGNAINSGVPPLTYSWLPVTGLSDPTILNPTFTSASNGTFTYSLTVHDASGTSATASVTINVGALSVISCPDIVACIHSSNHVMNGTVSGGSGNYNYNWSPSLGLSCNTCIQPTVSPVSAGNYDYTLTVTDAYSGCMAADHVTVMAGNTFPAVTAPIDQYSSCPGKDVTLVAASNCSGGGCSYHWYGGSDYFVNTTQTITVSPFQNTTYTIEVTDNTYGCTSTAEVTVFVNQVNAPSLEVLYQDPAIGNWNIAGNEIWQCYPNDANFSPYSPGCVNCSINIYNSFNRFDNTTLVSSSFPWSQSNKSVTFMCVTADGCKAMKQVTIKPDKISYIQSTPLYGCFGTTFTLNCNASNLQNSNLNYQWLSGSPANTTLGNYSNSQIADPTINIWEAFPLWDDYSRYFDCLVDDGHGCSITARPQVVYIYKQNYYYTHPEEMLEMISTNEVNNQTGIFCGGGSFASTVDFSVKHLPYDLMPTHFSVNTAEWLTDSHPENKISGGVLRNSTPTIQWDFQDTQHPCRGFLNHYGQHIIQGWINSPCALYESVSLPFYVEPLAPVDNHNDIGTGLWGYDYISSFNTQTSYLGNSPWDGAAISFGLGNTGASTIATNVFYPYQSMSYEITHTEVHPNSILRLRARDEIVIHENFFAALNSEFSAGIDPCLYPGPQRLANQNQENNTLLEGPKKKIFSSDVLRAYPNPSTGKLTIEINLEESCQADLSIQDIIGNRVIRLDNGNISQKKYEVDLVVLRIIQGVYNIRLTTKGKTYNQKLVFIQ